MAFAAAIATLAFVLLYNRGGPRWKP